VLLVLFLTIVAGSLFPIALLDPGWQLRLGGALINSSPMPLTGLALLHLAARLAVPVALGYMFLLPSLDSAALQQQAGQSSQQLARISRATSQLEALRAAVQSATSPQDLGQRLAVLQGRQLEPADQGLSLPDLRRRVNAVLDQAAGQIARQKAAIPAVTPWRLAPEILRTSVACLALAVGFAGLAARAKSERSLLAELLWGWEGLGNRLRQGLRRPGARCPRAVVSPEQMMQRLVEAEQGPDGEGDGPRG
jgi:AraC-like DNA-binding protein